LHDVLEGKPSVKLDQLKRKGSVAANGTVYRKDIQGFLPELMEKMYQERKMYKKMMIDAEKRKQKNPNDSSIDFEISKYHNFQLVRKIQLNSAYGAIGNQYFRYYDVDMAEAITLSGQLSIKWIINHLNAFLNKTIGTEGVDYVVASDTDSVYLSLVGLVEKFIQADCRINKEKIVDFLDKSSSGILKPFIDKKYAELAGKMNAFENKMVMERECIADKGIWTAKKRYMLNVYDSEGIRYETPKMKIMGIETTRSSTPQVVRDNLKQAIKIILTGTEDELIEFVSSFKTKFLDLSIDEIAFPRSVNNISKFEDGVKIWKKGTPIAVKGALVYNKQIRDLKLEQKHDKIQDGDKIKFVSLREQNPFGCNVISFPGKPPKEFDLDKYVDYNKQFETSFLEPLKVILSHIKWDYERKAVLF
jgi:DNA polymerase elongation subunit (family B)